MGVRLALLQFCLWKLVQSQLQSISIAPSDTEVLLGGVATLYCKVDNQAGEVQWSKDGIMLTDVNFNRILPAYPRISITGDASVGVHNLFVINVTESDEADYACQVGPYDGHKELIERARLNVSISATSIDINDLKENDQLETEYNKEVVLKCQIKGGKPAPDVNWYRNGYKLPEGVATTEVTDDETTPLKIVTSTIKLNPLPDDNGAEYVCEAAPLDLQRVLPDFKPIRATAKLYVLFPPGRPLIEGYREGQTVKRNDTLNLMCISRGGNPLAHLTWLKNGVVIDHSFTSTDWESMNVYNRLLDINDDGATYTCRATSRAFQTVYETSVKMTVYYAPAKVTIDAPSEAKVGDVLDLNCTTDVSHPRSTITWAVDGRHVEPLDVQYEEQGGGWITRSSINVTVVQEGSTKLISCYALNSKLGETVVGTATVTILQTPNPPSIYGYIKGSAIRAGSAQRLTCSCNGGNPLPSLKWFKGDKEIAVQPTLNGKTTTGEIVIIASFDDNGARYRCEVENSATTVPLEAYIVLTVHFPPSHVYIKQKQKRLKARHKGTLICKSSSSNPPASIIWLRAGKEITPSPSTVIVQELEPASHGGVITRSTVTTSLSADDNGKIFTCKATNTAVQESVHDAISLNVLYKPIFGDISGTVTQDVKEGEPLFLKYEARANPSNVTYRWIKNNETILDGETLDIREGVKKDDAAEYVCQATNDIGYTQITVILLVRYAAKIEKPEGKESDPVYVIADVEEDPQLECTSDAYPLPEDLIKWDRDGFDMPGRTKTSNFKITKDDRNLMRSHLTITNVSWPDSGDFTCIAQNEVDGSDTYKITLLVKHPPSILDPDKYSTVKTDRDVTAEIICRAEGVPEINFTWHWEGTSLSVSERKNQTKRRVDHITWEGVMSIKEVKSQDFGEYMCEARNEVSFDSMKITLVPNSKPDPPTRIRVLNRTHDALEIGWKPGFNGGHNQTFQLRYKNIEEPLTKYIDVHPPNSTSMWLTGLNPNITYEIAMNARNPVGRSQFSEVIREGTKGRRYFFRDEDLDLMDEHFRRLLISTAIVVFVFLFVLSSVLLYCKYRRQQLKSLASKSDDTSSTYSKSTDFKSTTSTEIPEGYSYTMSEYSESTKHSSSLSHRTTSGNRSDSYDDTESYPDTTSSIRSHENRRWQIRSPYAGSLV